MTPEQFAYWLQGFSEIAGQAPTAEQWTVIQDHLKTVFEKITPDRQLIGTNLRPYATHNMQDMLKQVQGGQLTVSC